MEKDLEALRTTLPDTCQSVQAATGLDGSNWMSRLGNDVLLSALSIPGTHDSAAYTLPIPFIATQQMDVNQQLSSGCRYFDLRCGLVKDDLEMVHGSQRLNLSLDEILSVMYEWLNDHPSEALIVQLKKDRKDEDSTHHFSDVIKTKLSQSAAWWRIGNTTPRLGEVRGKIQLFRRFRGPDLFGYGMNVSRWQDNPHRPFTMDLGHRIYMTVQDHYKYIEPEPLPVILVKKESEILEVMNQSETDHSYNHWYINYMSTMEFNWYYRYSPRDLAEGGNYRFKHQRGINDRILDHIKRGASRRRYGVVVMDFPSDELISTLYLSNFAAQQYRQAHSIATCCCLFLLLIMADGAFGCGIVARLFTGMTAR